MHACVYEIVCVFVRVRVEIEIAPWLPEVLSFVHVDKDTRLQNLCVHLLHAGPRQECFERAQVPLLAGLMAGDGGGERVRQEIERMLHFDGPVRARHAQRGEEWRNASIESDHHLLHCLG